MNQTVTSLMTDMMHPLMIIAHLGFKVQQGFTCGMKTMQYAMVSSDKDEILQACFQLWSVHAMDSSMIHPGRTMSPCLHIRNGRF